MVSSFDRKSQFLLDLVQSSQEALSDTLDDCYSSVDTTHQQVDSELSKRLFETHLSATCSTCHVHPAAFSLIPCRHHVCKLCYQIRFRAPADPDILGGELRNTCDVCFKTVENVTSLCESGSVSTTNENIVETNTPIGVYRSLADTTSYRRLSSSEQVSEYLSTSIKWPVVKISNIPWDISVSQVMQFLRSIRFPPPHMHSHFVHIIIDRSTGKTVSNAFVELLSDTEAQRAISTCHRKPLKGRLVHVSISNQDELLKSLFPCWTGNFVKGMAIPAKPQSIPPKTGQTFINRQEINSLLTICRNYKIHFSRKCPERPFENIMSIVCKYPWYQPELVTALQRDHIYECLKLAIGKYMLAANYITIDPNLLVRMVRTGVMCPAFTERQQNVILNAAGQDCPEDIKHFIIPDHHKNRDSSSEISCNGYAETENGDEDTDVSNESSQQSRCDSSSLNMAAPPIHKNDQVSVRDASCDLNAWYDALPTSLLDILDNTSNMRHVGLQEFHSSFSTQVELQQPIVKESCQHVTTSSKKRPYEGMSFMNETQHDTRSAIEERIRLLCEQLRPLYKRKRNAM
ncbi:hypothetical protein BGW37DRAFT_559910 [Umbelopsis sp. PMI_123]|nr:hypothetical protein BGW37DRAFT_559910 [Umbelopsis sp. PMI_123]